MVMAASEVMKVRRIVDYLNDGEELGVEETPPRPPAATARFRWPRLARIGKKAEKTVAVVQEEEELVADDRSEQVPVAVSASEHEQAARKCESGSASGTRQYSGLGAGLSLVFLLAKTSDEFNKMVKVRTEMEALLKQVKNNQQQLAREPSGSGNGHDHDDMREPRDPESATSSCVTDRNDRSASAHLEEEQAVSSGTEAASCEKSSEDDEPCAGADVLEDEFHAELERLQVAYGSDVPLFAAVDGPADSEPSDDTDDYRHDYDDDESGEAVEDEEDNDDDETEYNGVSALELERRLHELLHERNRERIEELEAALRRAEKKLAEKELEVCLWKDTAKFALKQENELP